MLAVLLPVVLAPAVAGLANGIGRLPAMGWNSWNAYDCDITEAKFLDAAEKMVSLGLKDAGYAYVNIDDCWSEMTGRDPTTQRLVPNATRFPDNGIQGTADKVHAMGLKIGIYSSAGTETCAGYPASIGYEEIDAETWADWGIDYLKYDNCNIPDNWTDVCDGCVPESSDYADILVNGTCTGPGNWCPAGYNYSASNTAERYRIMRDALANQKRPILYSICDWGLGGVEDWGNATGHSWRSTGDIKSNWTRIVEILNENSFYLNNANFWGRPDPDMLEVGNPGLSAPQTRTHFALWAAMKSPLLIGTDLSAISDDNVAILKNKHLLAFNQDDVYGAPATPYRWGTNADWTFNASFPAEYWAGESRNGTLALVFNPYSTNKTRKITFAEIPQLTAKVQGRGNRYGGHDTSRGYRAMDIWTDEDLGCFEDSISVDIEGYDTAGVVLQEC